MSGRADPDRACLHPNFVATVEVCRRIADGEPELDSTPAIGFAADIRVHCAACDEPFRWVGVPAGLNPRHPTVSIDDLELRAPLRPASSDPDFGLGGIGFGIRMTGFDDQ